MQYIVANNGGGEKHVSDDPCSERDEAFFISLDRIGDGMDGFNIGYDEIFSPYSNPNTNSCIYPSTNSGLTISLLQNNHGNITVKVYFDDNVALDELPPAKPKNLKTVKHIINPSTGRFNPKLLWDLNTEPDFKGTFLEPPGFYKIYRGVQNFCDPDAEPTIYYNIANVPANTNEYVDNSIYLYPNSSGGGICTYQFKSYSYKIEAIDNSNKNSLKSERAIINGYEDPCAPEDNPNFGTNNEIPTIFQLLQNYPNPFNPSTQIKFSLPRNTFVTIKVFNAIGQEVAKLVNNEYSEAGNYSVVFDGSNHASGIYFYSIEAGEYKDIKKMVLIK